jgi:hypothetical protein
MAWSDIVTWSGVKAAAQKILAADFNLLNDNAKKVYDNTVYLKSEVAAISNTTLYTSSNYAVLNADGYRNIFVYANTGDVTITLPEKSANLNRPLRIVYAKGGTYKVIVNPHANDANKLSCDGMASMWLAKVGDYVEFIESADTGFWEVVNESITTQLRFNTHAGYGNASNNKIPYFTNVIENIGNMIALTSNDNVTGCIVTLQRSGKYSITYNSGFDTSGRYMGVSKNSNQLTTAIQSITIGHIFFGGYHGTAIYPVMTKISRLLKNDVFRPHTDGSAIGATFPSFFEIIYLGK